MQRNLYSFPKSTRLLKKSQYQVVFDGQNKVSGDIISVFALANQHDAARLGLAISRKCSKRATDRNRIKRIMRETFRIAKLDLPALDFVVTCKPSAVKATNFALQTSFLNQIKKVCQRICAN